jgi:hypothetical protein
MSRAAFRRRGVGWTPVVVDGHRFISQGEADRYSALVARHANLRVETSETASLLVCTRHGLTETFRLAGVAASTNKHNAKRTTVDGLTFASKHEAARYTTLRLQEMAGEIIDLNPHPVFEFIVNGVRIGKFTPDFQYTVARGLTRGEVITEDAKYKGTKTEAYQLRKKLLWACHRVPVTEVYASK